jgi:acetolactate synthase-1/3 small subunit
VSARRRTFIVHLDDDPGALNRVVNVLRKRSLNIASLTVARTATPGRSRLTLVAEADAAPRLAHQLRKVLPVATAEEVTEQPTVERELALVRVGCRGGEERRAIAELAERHGARLVADGEGSAIVEVAGPSPFVDRVAAALGRFGIVELARSGPVAMVRGVGADNQTVIDGRETLARETD